MNSEWSLDELYKGFDDPKFAADLAKYDEKIAKTNEFAAKISDMQPLDALKTYIDTERKALIDRCQKMNVGDTDAVFLSLQVTRLSVRAIQNIVKKYAQTAAPLKKISPHKLRSTFGTNLYRATGDIYLVADVLGHRDVNTTKKHYAAIEEDHRKLAAQVVKLRPDKKDQ